MKKLLLTSYILIAACVACLAQEKRIEYAYTEWHKDDCYAHLYCDSVKLLPPNKMANLNKNNDATIIRRESGEKIVFSSDQEVISYLSRKGWVFIQAAPLSAVVVRHYFKRVTNE